MTGMDHVAALSLIRSAASSNGLALSPEAATKAAEQLAKTVTFDADAGGYVPMDGPHRAYRITDGRAENLPFVDHVIGLARAHSSRTASKPKPESAEPASVPVPPSSTTAWAIGRIDPLALIQQSFDRAHDNQVREEMKTWPNPWKAKTFNRTRQAIITNNNPKLAERLRGEAA